MKGILSLLLASLSSVASAAEDDIMDIRGMRGLSFWEANWQWAVPSIIVSLIVIGLIIYFGSKKKPEPPLTPYQLAQKELNEASMQMGTGDDKAFSFAVSDALRHYLEGAFRIRAPEQTTEEFLETAKVDKRIAEDALETLAEFLALCDLAKFARHAFGEEERTKLLSTAKEFVQKAHTQRIHAVSQPTAISK
ncbi:hypothetical protein [Rubellicoccus peritrichatus]|uniref:DUF4129 domain-containing protein n=1 Tax=Rubellicoccus peritrichatus TaxID=3080537 RepID=A0AAQ3LE55_9BACT|nr:hypothetical protein [Puniceicoccus sp. CR14]WOO42295.1 hypothetical protein RZN69_04280 [Puniceicoccus sp. CR14]